MSRTDPRSPGNAALRAFVNEVVGPGWRAEDRSRTVGRRSIVWRIHASDGRRCYLKCHEARKLFERAVAAHRTTLPSIGRAAWFVVPELLGVSDELDALVITEIPGVVVEEGGVVVEEGGLPGGVEVGVYELAGRFAARLHAVPVPLGEDRPWPAIWMHRVAQWLPLAEGMVGVQTMAWAYELAAIHPSEPEPPVVPTHSDFSPRNWIWRRAEHGGVLGVIDWERARASLWIEDLWRMAYDHWHDEPARREAWLRGYGRQPTAGERLWIRRLAAVHALGGLVWAAEHGDEGFADTCRLILERVRAEPR